MNEDVDEVRCQLDGRGELLVCRWAGRELALEVSWGLHCRVHADRELRWKDGSTPTPAERLHVLRAARRDLRNGGAATVEIVGATEFGNAIQYTLGSLEQALAENDATRRNAAIHELDKHAGPRAARAWYRVLVEDEDEVCVASALGLLLEYAELGIEAIRGRAALPALADTRPGSSERRRGLDSLRAFLTQKAPRVADEVFGESV